MTFVWVLALIGSIVGGFTLFGAVVQGSAPQQGALAAVAVGLAVIPYCFARALSEIGVGRAFSKIALGDPVTCPSCGKWIRLRKNEVRCYRCGGEVGPTPDRPAQSPESN